MSDPRPRSRRRRILRWTLFLAGALVVLRLALGLALPDLLRSALRGHGLLTSVGQIDLSLLGASLEVRHLELQLQADESAPLRVESLRFDLSVLALLRGDVVIPHLELDGIDLRVERDAAGRLRVAGFPVGAAAPTPAADAPSATDATPERPAEPFVYPESLESPLVLRSLRIQNLRVTLHDQWVRPPRTLVLDGHLRLSGLGSRHGPARLQLLLTIKDALDSLSLESYLSPQKDELGLQLALALRGARPAALAPWLQPLGVRAAAQRLDLDLDAGLRLALEGSADGARGLALVASVGPLQLGADGAPELGWQELALRAHLAPGLLDVEQAHLSGLFGGAGRTAEGLLALAGLELAPGVADASETPDGPGAPAYAPQPVSAPLRLRVRELLLEDHRLLWRDASLVPPEELAFRLDELRLSDFDTGGGSSATLFARLSAEGLLQELTLAARERPSAATGSAELELSLRGLRPDALGARLAAAGLAAELDEGTLALRAEGSWDSASGLFAALHDLKLADGTRELLALDDLSLARPLRSAGGGPHLDEVALSGLRADAWRDAEGRLHVAGLVLGPRPEPAAATPAGSPAAPLAASEPLTIGRLTWQGADLCFDDQGLDPPARVVLADLGLEVRDLALGAATLPAFGSLALQLRAPGLVEWIALGGSSHVEGDARSRAELELSAEGLTLDAARPWLTSAGLEPTLGSESSLSLGLFLASERGADGDELSLAVRDLRLLGPDGELLSCERAAVERLAAGQGALRVGSVELAGLRVAAARDAQGALALLGLRQLPSSPAASPPEPPAATEAPASDARKASPSIVLGPVTVRDVALAWSDRAFDPPVQAQLVVQAMLDGLHLGAEGPPATFALELSAPGAIEALRVEGRATLDESGADATLRVAGHGLRAGPLARYLPAGLDLAVQDGRLAADLAASLRPHAEGGHALVASLERFDWRDGEQPEPLLAVDVLRVSAPRLDPAQDHFAVDELVLEGLQAWAAQEPGGALRAAGLRLLPALPSPSPTPPVVASATLAAALATPDAATAAPAAAPVAPAGPPPRTELHLGRLDLGLRRIVLVDETRPQAVPVVLRDVTLRTLAPVSVSAQSLEDEDGPDPVVRLTLAGRLDPLLETLRLDVEADPFGDEAHLLLDLSVAGLRGLGLTEAWPELRSVLDGSLLSDGRLSAQVELACQGGRTGPLDFDLRDQPFEAELREVSFRNGPQGEVLAGFDSLRLDVGSLGARELHVRAIELERPAARLLRGPDGLQLLGLRLLPPATPPAAVASQPLANAPPKGGPTSVAPPPVPPGPAAVARDVRIDRVWIGGLDLRWEDRASAPPLVLPLVDLDLELRGFTTRAFRERVPLQLDALLAAGAPGALGPAFDEVFLSSRLALFPRPDGWVRLGLGGLQLAYLKGPAAGSGVTLDGGVLDASVDLEFAHDGRLHIDAGLNFTDLALSEGKDGPISRWLSLPAPLDTVVFLLRDEAGTIELPLSFTVAPEGLSAAQITRVATTALSSLILDAVAASPLRVVGTVGDMAGAVGGLIGLDALWRGQTEAGEQTSALAFEPGGTRLAGGARTRLDTLARRLRKEDGLQLVLRHRLAEGDRGLARARANPDPDECLALSGRLRQRKGELLSERAEAAASSRGALAVGEPGAIRGTDARLRRLDEELARTERALDDVLGILAGTSERRAEQRTRAACLEIAHARLQAVRSALLESSGIADERRLRIVQPRYEIADPGSGGGAVEVAPGKMPR